MRQHEVAAIAQLACLLEVSAPKPGNVSPGRHFADTRYEDFLASATAIGEPLSRAAEQPLGTTIRRAVEATRRWTSANTNLGIILLLAPLARAALRLPPATGERADGALREAVRAVLDETTVGDAREVYAAIRLAAPGGLGRADEEDVAAEPTRPLTDVMRLAADRDGIAREYARGFETTFGIGAPALRTARRDGLAWDEAITEAFLTLLAAAPDTHVVRRGGAPLATAVSREAAAVLAAGGVRTDAGREKLAAMDGRLRGEGNTANPGTTADLTAAAVFVELVRTHPPGAD